MKPTTTRIFIILAAPLLMITALVLMTSRQNSSSTPETFVHPQVPGGNGMLRAQGDTPSGPTGTIAPTSENVTDTYYHEIFVLQEKVSRTPEDTLSMRQLGRLLQDGHKMAEADHWYSEYLDRHPQAKQVWLDLSATRASDKRWNEAEEAIQSMLKRYPSDASAHYNLAAIAANTGDLERAQTLWEDLSQQTSDPTIAKMASRSLARLTAK
jgi:tetratricopeptide (TPR) repeat protein